MLLKGVLLALATGLLWSLVGVFYNAIAKWRLSIFDISIVTNAIAIAVLLGGVTDVRQLVAGTIPAPDRWYILFVAAAGGVNMAGSLILQCSMVYGRSGVTWAIGQSALVVPFVALTVLYSEAWTVSGIAGTLAVLSGMALLSMKPAPRTPRTPNPGKDVRYALLAFALLGCAQTMTAATGHFAYRDPGALRAVLMCAGGFPALLAGKLGSDGRGFVLNRRAWLLIVLIALENVAALYLSFRAIDLLAAAGKSAAFFPLAVGMCIAGYEVAAAVIFRERAGLYVVSGTAAILAGIASYCAAGG